MWVRHNNLIYRLSRKILSFLPTHHIFEVIDLTALMQNILVCIAKNKKKIKNLTCYTYKVT